MYNYAYVGPVVWVYACIYIIMLFDMRLFVFNVWLCFSYFVLHRMGHLVFQFYRTGRNPSLIRELTILLDLVSSLNTMAVELVM